MDWLDYREKLGIGFDDKTKVRHCITKIFNVLEDLENDAEQQIDENEYFVFCNTTATPMNPGLIYGRGYSLILRELERHQKNLKDFVAYYIAFINCQKDAACKKWTRDNFKNILCNSFRESHIPFEIIEDNGDYFLFPKGVEEFDDALVSQVLIWLKDYPQTEKAWTKALKAYAEVTDESASETADLFRKALERFFQEFFQSDKSLENLKSEYGSFLVSKGVPAEIRNNLEKLLDLYTSYMNNYAKHHDKTSCNVLEYIMYQTGNIIRMLITLSEGEI